MFSMIVFNTLLEERLQRRPAWRKSSSSDVVERMIQFNRWLKEHASTTNPPMTLYDNSHQPLRETSEEIAQWIRQRL